MHEIDVNPASGEECPDLTVEVLLHPGGAWQVMVDGRFGLVTGGSLDSA